MDKIAYKALKKSIKHYTRIILGEERSTGASDCALCSRFLNRWTSCSHCPVRLKTGVAGCVDTPWVDLRDHMWNDHEIEGPDVDPGCKVCRDHARKEREFLENLLPEYQDE